MFVCNTQILIADFSLLPVIAHVHLFASGFCLFSTSCESIPLLVEIHGSHLLRQPSDYCPPDMLFCCSASRCMRRLSVPPTRRASGLTHPLRRQCLAPSLLKIRGIGKAFHKLDRQEPSKFLWRCPNSTCLPEIGSELYCLLHLGGPLPRQGFILGRQSPASENLRQAFKWRCIPYDYWHKTYGTSLHWGRVHNDRIPAPVLINAWQLRRAGYTYPV